MLAGATVGALNFVTGTAGIAPAIGYSTNAFTINASTSTGDLIMLAGDANFAGTTGDTISGATGAGNYLGGSLATDAITSNSAGGGDFIYTDGGADTVTLAAGHSGSDHVELYAGNSASVIPPGAIASVAGAITNAVGGGFETANPGWWGVVPGTPSAQLDTLVLNGGTTGVGTSADQATINNFNPGTDVLDFSVKAWGSTAFVNGLTQDTPGVLAHAAAGAITAVDVSPGGTIAGTGANLIVLSQGSFLNAQAVAQALENPTGSYNIFHSHTAAVAGGKEYDFLIAYQGQDGNAHIADLYIQGNAAGTSVETQAGHGALSDVTVKVSDMATLVGVNIAQLDTALHAGHAAALVA